MVNTKAHGLLVVHASDTEIHYFLICEQSPHFVLMQASSPLQVKYADGELERLGENLSGKRLSFILHF